jgi:hypothetical protein
VNLNPLTGRAWTLRLLLGMMCLPAGCQQTSTTRTDATEMAIAADVCRAWRPVTYSSLDSEQTVLEVRASNAARDAYCGDQHAR